MDSFSNPWVIGIAGGVISGLLVTAMTRYLFARREQREYRQKVATANNEIIYAVRPAVAEKALPSSAMLDALFAATARKYEVNSDDLMSKAALANELIKEVMDNTFLASQQKVQFCELLTTLKQPAPEVAVERRVEVVTVTRREGIFDPSAFLGLTTGLMALVTTLYVFIKDREDFLVGGLASRYLPMLVAVAVLPAVAYLMLDFMRRLIRVRQELEKEKVPRVEGSSSSESQAMARESTPNKPMQPTP